MTFEPSRRALLTGISLTTAVGVAGCLAEASRYQAVFINSSNKTLTGEVSLLTEKGETISSTSLELDAGESTQLIVSIVPHKTKVDLDSVSAGSYYIWGSPSCVSPWIPTQTVTLEEPGTVGIKYGCKLSQK